MSGCVDASQIVTPHATIATSGPLINSHGHGSFHHGLPC
jgi:hypothetical protein